MTASSSAARTVPVVELPPFPTFNGIGRADLRARATYSEG